jgi:hypothetical protein
MPALVLILATATLSLISAGYAALTQARAQITQVGHRLDKIEHLLADVLAHLKDSKHHVLQSAASASTAPIAVTHQEGAKCGTWQWHPQKHPSSRSSRQPSSLPCESAASKLSTSSTSAKSPVVKNWKVNNDTTAPIAVTQKRRPPPIWDVGCKPKSNPAQDNPPVGIANLWPTSAASKLSTSGTSGESPVVKNWRVTDTSFSTSLPDELCGALPRLTSTRRISVAQISKRRSSVDNWLSSQTYLALSHKDLSL